MKKTSTTLLLALLAALLLDTHPATAAKVFRAGAHAIDITPETLPVIVNGGFLQGQSSNVTDRLHSRSLVLDDGKTRLVIAVVDTCMMTRELIDEAKALAATATSIPTERMLISATHTHSAPSAMGCLGTSLDVNYAKWLPGKIAEGIALAAKNLAPARVGWAVTDNWEQTNCRRWITRPDKMQDDPFGVKSVRAMMHPGYENPDYIGPAGPIDPGLTLLAVQSLDGRPLALLANYSMHYFGAAALSADYYGRFSEGIGQLIGAGAGGPAFVGIMSQGTSGDSHWMDYSQPQKKITLDQYSEAMMRTAADAVKKIQYRDHVSLAMAESKLTLRRRVADDSRLAWARKIVTDMGDRIPKDRVEVYAREQVMIAAEPERELKLQAVRIGGLGIAAIPNEVYAITGLKLKAQSPLQPNMNVELANGSDGYIPPPEQHKLGGYTTWAARTAGLEPQAEPRIVEEVLGLLEKVSGKKRLKLVDVHGPYAKAVLAARPLAYWRLNEIVSAIAHDATGRGNNARYHWEQGIAFYLPGVGNGVGASSQPSLETSAFSGANQINRAPHFAGGSLQAEFKKLGPDYTVSFWLWNGLQPTLRATTGIAFVRGNERLGITGTNAEPGRLFFAASADQTPLVGKTALAFRGWHHVAIVREGRRVAVYLDGQMELEGEVAARATGSSLRFAGGPMSDFSFEGKLDEAAVFDRPLSAADIANQFNASGPFQRSPAASVNKPTAAVDSPSPKFPDSYKSTLEGLKPALHWPLRAPSREPGSGTGVPPVRTETHGRDARATAAAPVRDANAGWENSHSNFNRERLAVTGTNIPTGRFSVSLWFRNDLATDVRPVTGYFFSRGPDGDAQAPGEHLGIGGNYQSGYDGRLIFFNGNERGQILVGRTVLAPGSWNHVVLIRDGSKATAYLNGRAEPEFAGEIDVTAPGEKTFFLGARSDNFAPFQGKLAEFAMFDRELKPGEIGQLFQTAEPQQPRPRSPTAKLSTQTPPLSPEESLNKIHLPAGYRVELVAAEPLLLDPVAFDWDERGRLWVVEMPDYPMGMDGKGKPGGRVRILEDTNGDGRYDKSTIFADGLSFPTGILTWRGGCLVTAAPDILFLEDRNHDGKADAHEKLFSGFNEGNQQLRVNGLRWGLDGWVYCANGGHHVDYGKEIQIASAQTGQKIALGARDFRFKPDTGELDPLSGPSQFGRTRDAWGRWFGVQNSYPLWHYVLEDRYLRRNPHVPPPDPKVLLTEGNPKVFPASPLEKRFHSFEQSGHFTSACAPTFDLDTLLFGPANRAQNSFTCEPFHNLVQHLIVEEDGVTFKVHRSEAEKTDFFASEDRWCRPVMTRTGPDGALWIADMYRYMIEHPEWLPQNGKDELLPFYRQGEDKGRIYRVAPNDAPVSPVKNLSALKSGQLVKLMESSNGWLRDKAQMMLVWRGDKGSAPALEKLGRNGKTPLTRLQALSTLQAMGALKSGPLIAALNDAAPGVREQALRLAESHKVDAVVAAAARLADDPDAKVRLQLACSLGEWTQPVAGEALARLALQDGDNPILRGAVLSSLLPHLATFAKKTQKHPSLVESTFQTALGEKRGGVILQLLEPLFSEPNKTDTNTWHTIRSILNLCRVKNTTLEAIAARHSAEPRWSAVLENKTNWLAFVKSQVPGATASDQAFLASLLMCDKKEEGAAVEILGTLIAPKHHLQPLSEHLKRLAQSGDARVPGYLMQGWEQRTPGEREKILDTIMGREQWLPGLLSRALEDKLVLTSFDAQRQTRLLKHPSNEIRKLASAVFAPSQISSRRAVLEMFQPALSFRGEPAKGKIVFGQACAACHQLEGVGQAIGPDLRSVAQHAPDKLLAAILDPSADIQPGFMAYFCERNNGEQLYGIVAGETGTSITLKLADGATRTILRDDIQSLQSSNVSLMPEGLEAALNPQTMADLIAYLKQPK